MQHVYAVVFSAILTSITASLVLYYDYGFWHEKYTRTEDTHQVSNSQNVTVQSPGQMLGSFFQEANARFKSINTSTSSMLNGKEVYTKDTAGVQTGQ